MGPNYEWLIVEFVTLNLFVGNSFGTPAILCIWWFWHWEGQVDQTSPLCGGKLSGAGSDLLPLFIHIRLNGGNGSSSGGDNAQSIVLDKVE